MIEYMGTGYGSTRFALITEQANATWKLKSFKIEEKRFTPKTSCGVVIPIDNKDYNTNTTPLFTASSAITTVSVPATPTPKRVMITGSIAAGASPAQFGASLSFSTTVGKVYTIYLENVSLETTNLAPSYRNYTGYAVVNNPADAGDEGKMLTNGSLGYTSCYKGYAITFVARATTTWLMLGGMVAAQDAAQPATVSIQLQKLRIVGSQPIRRTVQLLAKGYRFGFNGKENDDEVKGKGNQQDYGMRIYDPRLGKFLSVDPLTIEFPMLTPYQFASNRPIDCIDLDGLESAKVIKHSDYNIQLIPAGDNLNYVKQKDDAPLLKIKYERLVRYEREQYNAESAKILATALKPKPKPSVVQFKATTEIGLKAKIKVKVLGAGGEGSMGVSRTFTEVNITESGSSRDFWKEPEIGGSFGAGIAGTGVTFSESSANVNANLGPVTVGNGTDGLNTGITVFDIGMTFGVGFNFSLKLNTTPEKITPVPFTPLVAPVDNTQTIILDKSKIVPLPMQKQKKLKITNSPTNQSN